MTDQIPINFYQSIYQAYVHSDDVLWMSFPEIVEFFQNNQSELQDKTAGLLFNCCSWRDDPEPPELTDRSVAGLIRRCRQNVAQIYCLLLDIDGTMSLESAVADWAEYEFLIYSTYRHTQLKPKFRLVVPLAEPLTREQFDQRHEAMIAEFNVDAASFTISQAFYLPSHSPDNRDQAFVVWNQSDRRYSALGLPVTQIPDRQPARDLIPGQRTPDALSVYRTLITGRNLHYSDVLPLAVLCKSRGLTCEEFVAVVQASSATDSVLRTGSIDIPHLYDQGYKSLMTKRKMISLMNRMGCDMWRWQPTPQETAE